MTASSVAMLEELMVRRIRQWRPEVVVTEAASPRGDRPLSHVINQLVLSAVRNAADATSHPDHATVAGLQPWTVKKVFSVDAEDEQATVTLTTAQLAARLGCSVADQAAEGYSLVCSRYEPVPVTVGFRLLLDELPQAVGRKDIFSGIFLPAGGEARRQLGPPTARDIDALTRAAQTRRNVEQIFEKSTDATGAGRGLARTGPGPHQVDERSERRPGALSSRATVPGGRTVGTGGSVVGAAGRAVSGSSAVGDGARVADSILRQRRNGLAAAEADAHRVAGRRGPSHPIANGDRRSIGRTRATAERIRWVSAWCRRDSTRGTRPPRPVPDNGPTERAARALEFAKIVQAQPAGIVCGAAGAISRLGGLSHEGRAAGGRAVLSPAECQSDSHGLGPLCAGGAVVVARARAVTQAALQLPARSRRGRSWTGIWMTTRGGPRNASS